ncbi:protein-glutamate O-methyltransferase family protein [Streptomyces sp. PTM05]|uniref:Protein-glutamate O-methyltransferase family protein n=1 Tax=Streptantibioticus parmotrematis TaxID=2873249 RepID=A0ABS7QNM7_9ACTN|nr:damage-control phosphatase ARMT1 family protein [Streptantibioticus parmotrematis]MBY8884772.1 protein-glutamate O-methyltransferase family protein [Streptantibioticus parmotrematis]
MPEAANTPPLSAPVITSETPGSFARGVLDKRHPALIQQVRDAFPYGPEQHQALDSLLQEITGGAIAPLPAGTRDESAWARWGQGYFGRSWFEVPFLWAESYFYRRLLGAVGYFERGPWQGIDPFAPFKRAELRGSAVAEELAALDEVADLPLEGRDRALLHGALWGNRADLGFRISSGEAREGAGNLIVDNSALLWRHLGASPNATVYLVADNAGRELIPDLVLIDHLLHTGRASAVVLHVKPYPYYVSDATMNDVIDNLRRVAEAPGRAGEIGDRLWDAMGSGRLAVRAHSFSCAPLPYADMPEDLRDDFARATLTIFKGDLNYRRLVGDQLLPATASFADRTSYFPGPVVALRTLKSDVIVGLDAETLAALETTGEAWRTSGTHAVIQGGL